LSLTGSSAPCPLCTALQVEGGGAANDEERPDYENEVLEDLQQWAGLLGAEVHHVGVDNRPSDVLIKVPAKGILGIPLLIIIETRYRQSAVDGGTRR
jgi:hypothetical protein